MKNNNCNFINDYVYNMQTQNINPIVLDIFPQRQNPSLEDIHIIEQQNQEPTKTNCLFIDRLRSIDKTYCHGIIYVIIVICPLLGLFIYLWLQLMDYVK